MRFRNAPRYIRLWPWVLWDQSMTSSLVTAFLWPISAYLSQNSASRDILKWYRDSFSNTRWCLHHLCSWNCRSFHLKLLETSSLSWTSMFMKIIDFPDPCQQQAIFGDTKKLVSRVGNYFWSQLAEWNEANLVEKRRRGHSHGITIQFCFCTLFENSVWHWHNQEHH